MTGLSLENKNCFSLKISQAPIFSMIPATTMVTIIAVESLACPAELTKDMRLLQQSVEHLQVDVLIPRKLTFAEPHAL